MLRSAVMAIVVLSVFTAFMIPAIAMQPRSIEQELETITFPSGTYVIPMDGKQSDIIQSFGFMHKVTSEGATIFRIIQPPDITLCTTTHPAPAGDTYTGGPVLVMAANADAINAAKANFPTVTVDTLTKDVTSDKVFRVPAPTKILIIYGIYAHTQDVLDAMGIPYTMVYTGDVEADPDMLFAYDLVVDDCPGWAGKPPSTGTPPDAVMDAMKLFVERGGELIFTDISFLDMDKIFPGYATVVINEDGVWDCTVHNPPKGLTEGEFPSQYYGPDDVKIYTMTQGRIFSWVKDPDVSVVLDSDTYGTDDNKYRILAAYFNYGEGIVEGFAFHPHEQTEAITGDPDSYTTSCILYGNKFVHRIVPSPRVEGYVYVDANKNCRFDTGEEPVNGVTVTLSKDGTIVGTTVTNSYGYGYYSFGDDIIELGTTYTVAYNTATLPADLKAFCDDDGGDPTRGTVTVPVEGGIIVHDFATLRERPPDKVPALTPFGIAALVGLLGLIGTVVIRKRR